MKTMKMGSLVRFSMVAAVVAVAGTASARDMADPVMCFPDGSGNIGAVICNSSDGGGSPSTFLGAFASDNGGQGGWVEFYSDDDGEYWVEHHKDGSTSVGWDDGGSGANYVTGPKIDFGTKEGSNANKPRPKLKGLFSKGPKRSYAAAKAAAAKTTGNVSAMTSPATTTANGSATSVAVSLAGSGQCKANIVVHRGSQFVSSTGILPVVLPSKQIVPLPAAVGTYTLQLVGKDGCLGQSKTAQITVQAPRVAAPPKLVGTL